MSTGAYSSRQLVDIDGSLLKFSQMVQTQLLGDMQRQHGERSRSLNTNLGPFIPVFLIS